MSEGIRTIEAAMRADAETLRIIGQNIANAEVTAYRRQIPVHAAVFDELVSSVVETEGASASISGAMQIATDTRPGVLKATGEPMHVALEGEGFFAVQSSAGTLLTRRGDFHLSSEGVLTSASGHAVLGASGPMQLPVGKPSIDTDGTIRVGNDVVDRLRVVHASDPSALQYLGDGTYMAPSDGVLAELESVAVRQGFLEASNVSPVNETVQLMETLRHFEAAQRVVHGYDQMIEKAISELGKVT